MKPVIVLDCSMAAAMVLPDEAASLAHALHANFDRFEVVVPALWVYEFSNTLAMTVRRNRVSAQKVLAIMSEVDTWEMQIDRSAVGTGQLFGIAQAQLITAYDAAYLELAQRLGGTLATLDKALTRAAQALYIPLFEAKKD